MKKDVKGYEGLYEIELLKDGSTIIRSKDRPFENEKGHKRYVVGRELAETIRHSGGWGQIAYKFVNLRRGKQVKTVLKAKLILEHFGENPNGYKFVGYKDSDALNININNLCWVSDVDRFNFRTKISDNDKVEGNIFRGIREYESKIYEQVMSWDGHWIGRNSIRYYVHMCHNGKKYYIGTFNDRDDAVAYRNAYEEAVKFGYSYDVSDFPENVIFHKDLQKYFTNKTGRKI